MKVGLVTLWVKTPAKPEIFPVWEINKTVHIHVGHLYFSVGMCCPKTTDRKAKRGKEPTDLPMTLAQEYLAFP